VKRSFIIIGCIALIAIGAFWLVRPQDAPSAARQRSLGQDPSLNAGQFAQVARQIEGPLVSAPVVPSLSMAARDLPEAEFEPLLEREINPRQNPLRDFENALLNPPGSTDPLLAAASLNNNTLADLLFTFEGTSNFCSCTPPDTVGDVGPNHYVQMVNASVFNVYDKSGNVLLANRDLRELWASGNCAASRNGDPIVAYDGLADRWLLAQFSTGNGVCVAVSQTSDPTGAYYGYEFTTPSFPDYFKISVWPDAYYMTANESTYSALALDRSKMLAGQAASSVRFAGEDNLLLPADVDGPTAPPAGAPGLFYTFKDNSFHGGSDRLELFAFDVDWATPGNSTFTLLRSINISSFTYTVCGFFNLSCIPQAGTTQRVDPVSEWPMWRLAYRNFGTRQVLLGNFTVDVGSDRAGIRWFELRNTSGTWNLFQEGTYSFADTIHRWMGSIAMDQDGNIALGYSRSSSSLNPSIYFTTRLASDPWGTFGPEQVMFTGSGSQTGSNRWGDYSALSIDPADDCTFWYTQEYYSANSASNWKTRVGVFSIPSCGSAPTDTPTPTATSTATETATATTTATPTATPTASVTPSATATPTATATLTVTATPTTSATPTQEAPAVRVYLPVIRKP